MKVYVYTIALVIFCGPNSIDGLEYNGRMYRDIARKRTIDLLSTILNGGGFFMKFIECA